MNRLSESSSKSACSELGTVLLFLSPCFMKQGDRNKRTVPNSEQALFDEDSDNLFISFP